MDHNLTTTIEHTQGSGNIIGLREQITANARMLCSPYGGNYVFEIVVIKAEDDGYKAFIYKGPADRTLIAFGQASETAWEALSTLLEVLAIALGKAECMVVANNVNTESYGGGGVHTFMVLRV